MAIAIKVKTLPADDTRPTRLKVSAYGQKSIIYSKGSFDTNNELPVDHQAANDYANFLGWLVYNNWTYEDAVLIGGTLDQSISVFVIQYIKKG